MVEKEMQELLWLHPERFLNEPLKQFAREAASAVGRADLVFEDRHGRLLIIEVKRGKLPRGAIGQLLDYFGMMKGRFPEKPVEMMVVANVIPSERRIACESRDIECREISEKTFRDVATDVGFVFASETRMTSSPSDVLSLSSETRIAGRHAAGLWSFSGTAQSSADAQEFLSRCDEQGRSFFAKLCEAQKAASDQTKITWNHQSGFSIQFYFHPPIGFAPIVWGFPARNRNGKSSRQRLEFPFDLSLKAGVPEAFVNEFGESLSSLVRFSGGGKRPSIPIGALLSDDATKIIATIFSFAVKSSKK